MLASAAAALAALLAQQDLVAEALEQDWALAVAMPSAKKNEKRKIAFFMSVERCYVSETNIAFKSGFKSKLGF
jgi:hypothetical protein